MSLHVPSGSLAEDPEVQPRSEHLSEYSKQRTCIAYTSGSSARDRDGTLKKRAHFTINTPNNQKGKIALKLMFRPML
jgi:hypothetical protein